ncbi:hypothetical protein NQ317_000910 [Molorchus minor]|uniref:Uncharacterized protein n=1 Tax=Molorchus minor TaxID=1323400 RepID=A0ABQ9K1Z3_9CUCU|nr:hypothetical protein NQ317_000910 [Molorchus minor]
MIGRPNKVLSTSHLGGRIKNDWRIIEVCHAHNMYVSPLWTICILQLEFYANIEDFRFPLSRIIQRSLRNFVHILQRGLYELVPQIRNFPGAYLGANHGKVLATVIIIIKITVILACKRSLKPIIICSMKIKRKCFAVNMVSLQYVDVEIKCFIG